MSEREGKRTRAGKEKRKEETYGKPAAMLDRNKSLAAKTEAAFSW